MKKLFLGAFVFIFVGNLALGDEPQSGNGDRSHSTGSALQNRLKKALESASDSSKHRKQSAAPEKKSPLGFYLDIEFRGKQDPADSMGGEPILRKKGLVEIYGSKVDEKMGRTEDMLLERCKVESSPSVAGQALKEIAQTLMLDEARNLKSGFHRKKLRLLESKKEDPNTSLPLRRLALIAFLVRENAERRALLIPDTNGDKFELGLGSFESEFWENFAGPLEGEHAHERLRLRSQGKEGVGLLGKYDALIEDFGHATEVQGNLGTPKGGSGADQVVWNLGTAFRVLGRAGCLADDSKKKSQKLFAETISSLDWTERNRGMVLDFILGEQPPQPEENPGHEYLNLKQKYLRSKGEESIFESDKTRTLRELLKDPEFEREGKSLLDLFDRGAQKSQGF